MLASRDGGPDCVHAGLAAEGGAYIRQAFMRPNKNSTSLGQDVTMHILDWSINNIMIYFTGMPKQSTLASYG